jgi:hypothetical protein
MISKVALEERVREWSLREDVIEKEYVLGWLLWCIGSDPRLSTTWAFKGGTFAAANHLCVKLGYDGKTRIIEPYSLRRTRDGHLVLHALRSDSHAH